jgi:hypothetical protein
MQFQSRPIRIFSVELSIYCYYVHYKETMENLNRRQQALERTKKWRPDLLRDNKEKE